MVMLNTAPESVLEDALQDSNTKNQILVVPTVTRHSIKVRLSLSLVKADYTFVAEVTKTKHSVLEESQIYNLIITVKESLFIEI